MLPLMMKAKAVSQKVFTGVFYSSPVNFEWQKQSKKKKKLATFFFLIKYIKITFRKMKKSIMLKNKAIHTSRLFS